MDDHPRTAYWAGPALMTSPDPDDSPVAILVLWHRSPPDPDGADHPSRRSAELLDRGFAEVPEPGPDQLRRLPHLLDAGVRLLDDGRLCIDDGSRTLFEGSRYRASDAWHATVHAGGLTLLVDVEPTPDAGAPDGELNAWALARLTEACEARAVFGAHIDVVANGRPAGTDGWRRGESNP